MNVVKIDMKNLLTIICFFALNNTIFPQINIPNFIRHWAEDEFFFVGYNNQLYKCVKYEKNIEISQIYAILTR